MLEVVQERSRVSPTIRGPGARAGTWGEGVPLPTGGMNCPSLETLLNFDLKMVSFGALWVVFNVLWSSLQESESQKRKRERERKSEIAAITCAEAVNKRPGIDPANQRLPGLRLSATLTLSPVINIQQNYSRPNMYPAKYSD